MKKYLTAVAVSLIALSCTTTSGIPKKITNQPVLTGTEWQLADQVKGTVPTIVFEDQKIRGNAGCNRYFGNVTLDPVNGGFSTSNLGSTKMACQNMETEANFLSMLPKANKYRVSGNTLELFDNQLLLLKFQKTK